MEWALLLVVAFISSCIEADSDPAIVCDNPHETPDCLFVCPPQRTCINRNIALPCIPPRAPCKPQCVCIDGYARNPLGTCVTFEQCDKCPGYTQYFACDGEYDEHCQGSCHCNSGYERDANNTCVSTTPNPVITYTPSPPPISVGNPSFPRPSHSPVTLGPVPIGSIHSNEGIPPIPPVPPVPAVPDTPEVPSVPAVEPVPEIPALTGIPEVPAVPAVPALPAVPAVPAPPAVPSVF